MEGNEFINDEMISNIEEVRRILEKYNVSIDDSIIITGYLEEAYLKLQHQDNEV